MQEGKLKTVESLFEGKTIRSIWDAEKEEYYFSVVDVISALTDCNIPKRYWSDLKVKLEREGSQVYEKIVRFKLKATDGKMRLTDTLDTKGILRLIESVPSPKAEPFKIWLASLGSERIDEVFDPEIAISRAITYYKNKGYSDTWIETRLKGILKRNALTETWKEHGINKPFEYGILTNEIYHEWSGMTASEYKTFKGIRKESLRDNMNDLELLLTDIGETATKALTKKFNPNGLNKNKQLAKKGGNIAKNTKENLERELQEEIISSKNNINLRYIEPEKSLKES